MALEIPCISNKLPEDVDAAGPQVGPSLNRRFLDDIAYLLLFHLTQKHVKAVSILTFQRQCQNGL